MNSQWKLQDNPFAGDAATATTTVRRPRRQAAGAVLELESSSPAAALAPGKSLTHTHRTIHLMGPEPQLDVVARRLLGTSISEIKGALPKP